MRCFQERDRLGEEEANLLLQKPQRIVDEKLKEKIRRMPCILNGTGKCRGRIDPEHITTVGAGGGDVANNLMPLCRFHHIQKGNKGIGYMIKTYPRYLKWLEDHQRFDIINNVRRKNEPVKNYQ